MKKALALVLFMFCAIYAYGEDFSFEIPDSVSKSDNIELSGNLDGKCVIVQSRKNSPLYRLQHFDQNNLSDYLSSCRLEFYLNGDYRTENTGVHVKTHSQYNDDAQSDFSLFELYGTLDISGNSSVQAGKRVYSWGKGYAFNPVGYVNPFKDPENPELSQAGILSINYEYIKSFGSKFIQNMSLSLMLIPPDEMVSDDFSEAENTDMAAKLYFLLYDTDIDFMGYYSDNKPKKIGCDFSRNIKENIEFHGELSRYENQEKYYIDNNSLRLVVENGSSYLFGFRWLNTWNTTIIAEYYFNGSGLNADEYRDYSAYLLNTADSGSLPAVQQALGFSKNYFSSIDLMREYLYLKISQPEPFDWLYFTPSIYFIYNLLDNSYSFGVPLSYKPITNFEFLFWPVFMIGDSNTEFGEKQVKSKLELWVRFYF